MTSSKLTGRFFLPVRLMNHEIGQNKIGLMLATGDTLIGQLLCPEREQDHIPTRVPWLPKR
jgi:hypothetical protein